MNREEKMTNHCDYCIQCSRWANPTN